MHSAKDVVRALCRLLPEDPETMFDAILSPNRGKGYVAHLRWVAINAYRHQGDAPLNLTAVGRAFDRDRTSIRAAQERLQILLNTRSPYSQTLKTLNAELQKSLKA